MTFLVLMLGFTYGLSSVLLLAALNRFLKIPKESLGRFLLIAWGLGPLSIAWLLEWLFRFLPGHSDRAYVAAILTFFAALGAIGWKELPEIAKSLGRLVTSVTKLRMPRDLAALVLLAIVSWFLYHAFAMAMTQRIQGDDQLEYARLAQVFYHYKSFALYPNLTPNSSLGFAIGSFHPVSFPMLITWSHIIKGSATAFAYARLIDPMFLAMTIACLYGAFADRSPIFGATAAFLYVATPTIHSLTFQYHIDPFRIAPFQMAFALICFSWSIKSWKPWLVAGLGVGLSLNAHSTGLLALPIAAVCIALETSISLRRRMGLLAIVTGVALLVGGYRYIANFITLGSPITDYPGVWKTYAVDQEAFVRVTRQLLGHRDRIRYGLFRAFSEPQFYGWTFWAIPVALLAYKFLPKSQWGKTCLIVVVTYFSLATISTALEGSTFIKNFRYFLTIQPMVVSLAAFFLGSVHERLFRS